MKKLSLIVLITSSILFIACGEETKKATQTTQESVSTATSKAMDATKDAANKAVDAATIAANAAKEKAATLADEAKVKALELAKDTKARAAKLAEEAKKKATELAEQAKAKAVEATKVVKEKIHAATAPSVDSSAGAPLYAKCAGCHGKDGKTKALGKSALLAGQDAATLSITMKAYKAGTRNASGMGSLMKGQVGTMSDSDIDAVAAYIATF
jgi:cytochrome c553